MLICIFGKRGSGKTTMIKGSLEAMEGPVVVVDVLGNFNDENYIVTDKVSEMIDLIVDYKKDPKNKNKIFVLQTPDPDLAIEYVSATLWECQGGTLVLDEVDSITYVKGSCFDQLIRYGRNRGVNVVTGCRRPAELSRNVTAGANKIYVFHTQEPRDVDYFKSTVLGDKAKNLPNMPQFSGILVDYDRDEFCHFKIDELGQLFIINTESFHKEMKTLNTSEKEKL